MAAYDSEDEYLCDPITLPGFDCRDRTTTGNKEDFIDLTDEIEVPALASDTLTPDGTARAPITVKSARSSTNDKHIKQCRPLFIKIVDYKKYPWYYFKNLQTINKDDFVIIDEGIDYISDDTTDGCPDDSNEEGYSIVTPDCKESNMFTISPKSDPLKPKIRPVDISAYFGNMNYVTSKPKVKALEPLLMSSVKRDIDKPNRTFKSNVPEDVLPSTAEKDQHNQPIIHNKIPDIDFKRNQGLVGLKITRCTEMQNVVPNPKCSKEKEVKLKNTQERSEINTETCKPDLANKLEICLIPKVPLPPPAVQKLKDEKAKETLCADIRDSQEVKCAIQSNKETKVLPLKNSAKSCLFQVVKYAPERNKSTIEKDIASKSSVPNKVTQCEEDVNKKHKYLHDTYVDTIRMFKETKNALLKEQKCSKQKKARKSKKDLARNKISKHNRMTVDFSDGNDMHNEILNREIIMFSASNISRKNVVSRAPKKRAHDVPEESAKVATSDKQNSAAKKAGAFYKSTVVKTKNKNTKGKLKNIHRNTKMENSNNDRDMVTENNKKLGNHQMMPDIIKSHCQLNPEAINAYYHAMSNQPRLTYHKDNPSNYVAVQQNMHQNYGDVDNKINSNVVTNAAENGHFNIPVVKSKSTVLEQVCSCRFGHIIPEATINDDSIPTGNPNVVLTHGVAINNTTVTAHNARLEHSQLTPNEPHSKLVMTMPTTSDPNFATNAIDNSQIHIRDDVKSKIEILEQVQNEEKNYRFQYNVPEATTINVINSTGNPNVDPKQIVAINNTTETLKTTHTGRTENPQPIPNNSNDKRYILNSLPLRMPAYGNSTTNDNNVNNHENGNSILKDLAVNINNFLPSNQPSAMRKKMDLPHNMNNNIHNLRNTGNSVYPNFYMRNPHPANYQNQMIVNHHQYRSQYQTPQGRPIQTHISERYPLQNLYNVTPPMYSLRMVRPTRFRARSDNMPPPNARCAPIHGARPENSGLAWNRPRGPPPPYAHNGMWNVLSLPPPPPPPPPPPQTPISNQNLLSELPPRPLVGPPFQYRYESPVVTKFRTVETGGNNNVLVTLAPPNTIQNKTMAVGNNNCVPPAPSTQREIRNGPSVIVRNEPASFKTPTIQYGSVITIRDNGLVPVTRPNISNFPKTVDGNNQIVPTIQTKIDDRKLTNRKNDSVAQSPTTDEPKKPNNNNSLLSSPVIKTPEEQTVAVGSVKIPSPRSSISEGSTILGQNNDGFIRTINITARSPSLKDLNISSNITTVTTKLEMFEELMNDVKDIECPKENNVKEMPTDDPHKELKRILTVHGKYKPGPLCKKQRLPKPQFVLDQTPKPNTGYSPPILPIPTYDNGFELFTRVNDAQDSRLSPIIPETNSKIKHLEGTEHVENTRKRQLVDDEERDKSLKKISLDDYKRRITNVATGTDTAEGNYIKIKQEFGSNMKDLEIRQNPDLDLGYDSDSTVKL